MSEEKLQLASRQLTGKKLKKLREQGQVPSVVYGGGHPPVLTASPYNITEQVLLRAGYHSPVDLDIAGKSQMALVKSVDIDPIKRTIRNVSFQAVSADEVVAATTPIVIVNFETSEAHRIGLSTLQVLEEIAVRAKPADLPSGLKLDVSHLATIEDHLTIADLKLPKGVELADKELDPETAILTIFDPAVEAAQREAEAAKAAAEAAAAAAQAAPAPTPEPETTEQPSTSPSTEKPE